MKSKELKEYRLVDAPIDWIWKKLIDVERWGDWDKEVQFSALNSAFGPGAQGYLIDQDKQRSDFRILDVTAPRSYSNVYPLDEQTYLYFIHSIEGNEQPYKVEFTAWFESPDANQRADENFDQIRTTMQNALEILKNSYAVESVE